MKARAFALMMTAIVLGALVAGSASGIDNCCFVDRQCQSDQDWVNGYWAFQNNQCSAPVPAQSGPTGGAPAQIDNCCYVDRQCSTDLDWIGGWRAYQAGQCSATSPAPAPASSQPAGPAPANIDNCCYVDRQCSTDLDWMGGWHAYRAGQCGAPGQSQMVASSQPASGAVILRTASGIVIGSASGHNILPSTGRNNLPRRGQIFSYDNCCQLHWQCNSDQDWAAGHQAFQNNGQCALPGLISIVGDPDFVDFYAQRLDQLRTRLPHRYNYVLAGLDKIEMNWMNLADNVIYKWRTFVDNWNGRPDAAWDSRMSAVLVHEACHVHRHDAGYGFYSASKPCVREESIREELICREMELAVVTELGAEPHVLDWVRGMVARTRAKLQDPNDPGFCPVRR